MQQIQITLTITEVNQILSALGDLPYRDVYTLINSIQTQAQQQLANDQPETGLEPNSPSQRQTRDD